MSSQTRVGQCTKKAFKKGG